MMFPDVGLFFIIGGFSLHVVGGGGGIFLCVNVLWSLFHVLVTFFSL